jgi:signal transduction histidine kinase
MGIPKAALASIFEPFRQLGQASDRPQGGLKVSLTLVKRLVDKAWRGGGGSQQRAKLPAASLSSACRS